MKLFKRITCSSLILFAMISMIWVCWWSKYHHKDKQRISSAVWIARVEPDDYYLVDAYGKKLFKQAILEARLDGDQFIIVRFDRTGMSPEGYSRAAFHLPTGEFVKASIHDEWELMPISDFYHHLEAP